MVVKYLITADSGTQNNTVVPATIIRLTDNKQIQYLTPPFIIADETTSSLPSGALVVLQLLKNGEVKWTSGDLSLYQATLPMKKSDLLDVEGSPADQIQFQFLVLVAPANSGKINVIIDVEPKA